MKSNIETLDEILNLAQNNFNALKKDTRKYGAYTVSVKVANYSESLFVAADIMKMCIITLDSDQGLHPSNIMKYSISIATMLDVALQFIPFEEAEVLDEIQLLLKQRMEESREGESVE